MILQIIAPALPPAVDGIGDYTARLSENLSRSARVKILTADGFSPTSIPDVEIEQVFSIAHRRTVLRLADSVAVGRPDWAILQFQQFAFGRWGLNPFLSIAMGRIKSRCFGTRVAVMFHEDFVPPINWKFRVFRLWQKWQFKQLGQLADVVFFSIDPWVKKYGSWFPGKQVLHLPVGSNIPKVEISRDEAKRRLKIPSSQLTLGVFGAIHAQRNVPWLRAAIDAAKQSGLDVLLLYIGADLAQAKDLASGLAVIAEGPLPAEEVSRRLAAVDIFLAPFSDGVSTRRSSMMAGLEHGLATVGTRGELTDGMLAAEDGSALLLSDVASPDDFGRNVMRLLEDTPFRDRLGAAAQALYQREFCWARIAERLMSALETLSGTRDAKSAKVVAPVNTVQAF